MQHGWGIIITLAIKVAITMLLIIFWNIVGVGYVVYPEAIIKKTAKLWDRLIMKIMLCSDQACMIQLVAKLICNICISWHTVLSVASYAIMSH